MSKENAVVPPRQGFWSKATVMEKATIVAGLLYVLSPVDLIPEVLFGPLGLVDDAGAVWLMIGRTIQSIRRR